jgi:hypothetical protein
MNGTVTKWLGPIAMGVCLLVLIGCAVAITGKAMMYFDNLHDSLVQVRSDAAKASEKASDTELRTLILELKSDLKTLAMRIENNRDLLGAVTDRFKAIEEKLATLAERGNRMEGPERMGMPPIEMIQQKMREIFVPRLRQFATGSQRVKRAEGKFWEDGEFRLEPVLQLPEDIECPYRYFASPDRQKFTLVLIPNIEMPVPPEEQRNVPRFAFAVTQTGKVFMCPNSPVKMPEEFMIHEWPHEDNLPEAEWVPLEMEQRQEPQKPQRR